MTYIRPLRNEADYDAALDAIEAYFDNEPALESREADRFDLLALVIADYEAKQWAIEAPDAPNLLCDQMQRRGLKQTELAAVIVSNSRASEVLNRKRYLTPRQAWKIHVAWGTPTDALIKPYELAGAGR